MVDHTSVFDIVPTSLSPGSVLLFENPANNCPANAGSLFYRCFPTIILTPKKKLKTPHCYPRSGVNAGATTCGVSASSKEFFRPRFFYEIDLYYDSVNAIYHTAETAKPLVLPETKSIFITVFFNS
jgi:hypothetical protein